MHMHCPNIVAILLITSIPVSTVLADPYIIKPVSIEIAETYQDYLSSNSYSLRHRLVEIKSELLQTTLVELAESESMNDPATIDLQLFDDVLLSLEVISRSRFGFGLFAAVADSNCKSQVDAGGSNGSLEMSDLGHVSGRFWVCNQVYTIGPTRDLRLPYHVVRQLDPDNLPSID